MASLTKKSEALTEFSGEKKAVGIVFTASTNTNDTVTVTDLTSIDVAVATPVTGDADCNQLSIESISDNVLTVKALEQDGTVCTQNPTDFHLIVIGSEG